MSSMEDVFTPPEAIASHPAWSRLEGQRRYYSERAGQYQTHYRRIKLGLIALSASIPVLAFLPGEGLRYVVALAGVAIAMLEGVLLLNQYGPLGTKYRSTAESLKRERWLLLAGAGDYKAQPLDDAMRLLAERVEAILEEEHRAWTDGQKQVLEELARTQDWLRARLADAPGATAPPATGAPEPAAPIPGEAAATPETAAPAALDPREGGPR